MIYAEDALLNYYQHNHFIWKTQIISTKIASPTLK